MASTVRGPNASFYVVYGDEDFFLDRDLELARSWPGRRVVMLDGANLDEGAVVDQLESRPLDGEPCTIIVDDAQKMKESKAKTLRAYVDDKILSDTSSVLFGIVRGPKLPALWAHVGSKGETQERKKFKPWADKTGKTEYEKWIEKRAEKVGLGLDSGVSEFIFQMTGESLYRISNELRKLYLLVGNGNKVTKQHVASVIAVTPHASPYDVVTAAFSKNIREAMNSLSLVFKTMGEEAAVPIVYGLMYETQKVLTARCLLDQGLSKEDIAALTLDRNDRPMHPKRCEFVFLPMVRRHDQKSLRKLMSRLCKLDQDVKGSSRSKRTLVELTVLSIAG